METKLAHVLLSEIAVGQTNKMFRDESEMQTAALHDLIASIKEKGVIQPVLLRPLAKNGANVYELVCGERRFRASRAADLKDIPAYIRPLTDEEALEAQVIENLQRENVNPMKEAIAFEWMTKTKKMTTKQIADRIGKSQDYVQERIRLTTLHKDAQDLVRSGVLPLKAALKLASVPAQLHQKALSNCIATVEGSTGKQYTFKGLEELQRWLSYNVFNELAFADFDTNDTSLVPVAGSCLSCTKRTKNAGGLFDDVSKKDSCFDGRCFLEKQLAQYARVKTEVQLTFPGAEVVYQSRSYRSDVELKKTIKGPFIESHHGNEISKTEAKKQLEKFDKGQDPKIKIAVLIGVAPHDIESNKKKYKCLSFAKEISGSSRTSTASTPAQKAAEEKRKVEMVKQKKANEFENKLIAEAAVKKFQSSVLNEKVLQGLIVELLQETCNQDDMIEPLMNLGIKFKMSSYHTKSTMVFNGTDRLQDYSDYEIDDFEKVITTVKGKNLNAIAGMALASCFYGGNRTQFYKEQKIDLKAIATKAKSLAAAWYKTEQDKKKAAVKTFVKTEGRKPGKPAKKVAAKKKK
jgi:ParB/RepB/Spo0J family partition protein